MHDIGCLGLVHWDDLEGWYGEGGGRGGAGWGPHVHPWQIHVDMWRKPTSNLQFPSQHCLLCFILSCSLIKSRLTCDNVLIQINLTMLLSLKGPNRSRSTHSKVRQWNQTELLLKPDSSTNLLSDLS